MDVLKAGDHVTKNGQKGTVTKVRQTVKPQGFRQPVRQDDAGNELVRVLWNSYVKKGVATIEYSREVKKQEVKK